MASLLFNLVVWQISRLLDINALSVLMDVTESDKSLRILNAAGMNVVFASSLDSQSVVQSITSLYITMPLSVKSLINLLQQV